MVNIRSKSGHFIDGFQNADRKARECTFQSVSGILTRMREKPSVRVSRTKNSEIRNEIEFYESKNKWFFKDIFLRCPMQPNYNKQIVSDMERDAICEMKRRIRNCIFVIVSQNLEKKSRRESLQDFLTT